MSSEKNMTVINLPKPNIPDMIAVDAEATKHIEALETFLDTLQLVHHVDPVFLQASKNNLCALRSTLRFAIRVNR